MGRDGPYAFVKYLLLMTELSDDEGRGRGQEERGISDLS